MGVFDDFNDNMTTLGDQVREIGEVVSPMPVKGDLIMMNLGNGSKQYRVLKINGTVAECLAMYEYSTSCQFGSNRTYSGSNLDTILNTTFYNTLSTIAKSAIVAKNIIQYRYSYNSSSKSSTTHASYADYSTKAVYDTVGNRYIYALDVEDIEEYFGGTGGSADDKTAGTFSTNDIRILFWNSDSILSAPNHLWLRSTRANYSKQLWYVRGTLFGDLIYTNYTDNLAARPAFQIDLSKIPWTSPATRLTVPQMTTIVSTANDTIDSQSTLISQIQTALASKGSSAPSGSISITENGTYDVTDKASAVVNVSGGGGEFDINSFYNVNFNVTLSSGTNLKASGNDSNNITGIALDSTLSSNSIFMSDTGSYSLPSKASIVWLFSGYPHSLIANPKSNAIFLGKQPQANNLVLILGDVTLSAAISCFLPDTLITLADNSKKAIKDLTYNDTLKIWNFDTGTYDTSSICWLTYSGLHNDHYYKLTFSDGTILKTTGQNSNHKVYNVDEKFFKGVDKTEIGDRIFSENGIVTVTNKEYIEEDVEYYNLITTGTINCFAEGILTSDRYGNLYPIDEDMKYINEGREIRPYSEFEAVGIKRYWYDTLRLGEVTGTIEQTRDYIAKLECQMLDLDRTKEVL